jgi:hypothetical protein
MRKHFFNIVKTKDPSQLHQHHHSLHIGDSSSSLNGGIEWGSGHRARTACIHLVEWMKREEGAQFFAPS